MHMIATVAMIAALSSCGGDEAESAVVLDCGPRPPQPYVAVAFQTTSDGRRIAVMDRAVYVGLQAWIDDLVAWEDCAAEH